MRKSSPKLMINIALACHRDIFKYIVPETSHVSRPSNLGWERDNLKTLTYNTILN